MGEIEFSAVSEISFIITDIDSWYYFEQSKYREI